MDNVKLMLTLQAEYAGLLKMEANERPRSLEQVEREYAAALTAAMEHCAPIPGAY